MPFKISKIEICIIFRYIYIYLNLLPFCALQKSYGCINVGKLGRCQWFSENHAQLQNSIT